MLTNILVGILCLTWGFVAGVVTKSLLKPRYEPKDRIDEILSDFKPKETGDFIRVNKVESYLKDHEGDISIGDVIEDPND
jgi:hypothetical protein